MVNANQELTFSLVDGKIDLAEFLRVEYQRNLFGYANAKLKRDSTPFYRPIQFYRHNSAMHRFSWQCVYIEALAKENSIDLEIDPKGKLVNK